MDLDVKSVTVNPGFDSTIGSMTSFASSSDDLSFRNSVSSDYGSFYSDTLIPAQDVKSEVNYDYIQPRISQDNEDNSQPGKENFYSSTTSPTPSRSSVGSSLASSTSSNSSSKTGVTHRPPKPPPPPRAHSLLPSNKVPRNTDGTFKIPIICNEEVTAPLPSKPQAPRRQCKISVAKSEYATFDDQKSAAIELENSSVSTENISISTETTHSDISNSNISVTSFCSPQFNVQIKNEKENFENKEVLEDKDLLPSTAESPMNTTESHNSPRLSEQSESINLATDFESLSSTSITISTKPDSEDKGPTYAAGLSQNKQAPISKAPLRPSPIYSKPISVNFIKNAKPWKTLEDSYLVLASSNRELLIKLVNQALKKRKERFSPFHKIQFQWSDFEIDTSQPSSIFAFGEKIAYHATMPNYDKCAVTLVIALQQQQNRFQEGFDVKYPVLGQFTDFIPSDLLDSSCDEELESMQARVLVLSHSNVSTIECFTENLPETLTEDNENEICFIMLQLIQSLKSLQAQGIEAMDTSFQNLILAKTNMDRYHTLVFLFDNCYDENDFSSDSSKISLCQYALMLLFQILKVQSAEELESISHSKFSSKMTHRVYQAVISMLSEEKAISLSQTKVLLECFLWNIIKVTESFDETEDFDSMLHRWLDIERSAYIKNVINEGTSDISTQNEFFSQFLIRTSVRNLKEVISFLKQ